LRSNARVITVLIVDDEPNVVDLVRITLEDDRVRVLDASDAATALACLSDIQPDLVLLDVDLPDLSGLDICRRIRADGVLARTKVVMLTAAAQREDIARGREAGADEYLTKPFSPVRLLSLVEELLPNAVLWARG
jgi:two-component system, OmpR family, phosphate regulon response regulator PhoB